MAENRRVLTTVLDRADADKEHGFSIYQGGPPKHDRIRVVEVEGHDIQACGGTHVSNTLEIGEIKIVRSSQVQDGVERLVIMAGDAAREHSRRQSELLSASAAYWAYNQRTCQRQWSDSSMSGRSRGRP